MSNELEKISSFRYQLAIAETYEDIKDIDNKASVLAELLRRDKFSLEKQNELGIFRVQLEEKKGKWLDDNFPHGTDRKSEKIKVPSENLDRKMPVDKHESSRARRITNAKPEYKTQIINTIIKSGDVVTPGKVEKELKKQEQTKKITEIKNRIPELPFGIYDVIYADPPWQYEHIVDETRDIENQYPTDTIDNICNIKFNTSDNAILFLWVPPSLIEQGLNVCKSWGFNYRTHIVWDKESIGMGYFTRAQHELLFIARKGKMRAPFPEDRISSIYREKRKGHSEKPKYFYEYIEKAYPEGTYLELFSRYKHSLRWTVYGNEVV